MTDSDKTPEEIADLCLCNTYLREAIILAIRAAEVRGQEKMRERAAREFDNILDMGGVPTISIAIRELRVEP